MDDLKPLSAYLDSPEGRRHLERVSKVLAIAASFEAEQGVLKTTANAALACEDAYRLLTVGATLGFTVHEIAEQVRQALGEPTSGHDGHRRHANGDIL